MEGSAVGSAGSARVAARRLAALLRRVANGDTEALAELYERTVDHLFHVARAILREPADAEDVCAEVYAHVWARAAEHDPERGAVMTWLILLCRSRALDRLRSRGRHDHAVARLGAEDPPGGEVPDDPDGVHRALASLTPDQRQLVALCFYRGFTHAQLAEVLGVPLGTVKTRLRSAIGRLRESMHDEEP